MIENEVHIYHRRNVQHVFIGDSYAGIYSPKERIVRVRESMRQLADDLKRGFMRCAGIPVEVLAGADELKKAAPLMEFPEEIKALMSAELGERTPEVMTWAQKNFPADEYCRRYGGSAPVTEWVDDDPAPEVSAEEPAAPEEPADGEPVKPKRGRPAKS